MLIGGTPPRTPPPSPPPPPPAVDAADVYEDVNPVTSKGSSTKRYKFNLNGNVPADSNDRRYPREEERRSIIGQKESIVKSLAPATRQFRSSRGSLERRVDISSRCEAVADCSSPDNQIILTFNGLQEHFRHRCLHLRERFLLRSPRIRLPFRGCFRISSRIFRLSGYVLKGFERHLVIWRLGESGRFIWEISRVNFNPPLFFFPFRCFLYFSKTNGCERK